MYTEEKIMICFVLVFFITKLFFIFPVYSDEHIYFNMAKNMIEESLTPYKDFFYAHPPLQLYALSILFLFCSPPVFFGKILALLSCSICAFVVFLLAKEIEKKDRKIWLASGTIFLILPPVISYSSMENGMWPAILLALFSLYLLFKRKIFFSTVFFCMSIFFRYILLFYLPILIYFAYKMNKSKRFLIYFSLILSILLIFFILIFRIDFLMDTVYFHLFSKFHDQRQVYLFEYLVMNAPLVFLVILFLFINKKDKKLFLIPIIMDFSLLVIFRTGFYHYFLISIPFYAVSLGKIFFKTEYKFAILCLVFFMIFAGKSNIIYNNSPNRDLLELKNFAGFTNGKTVFGDPIVINYLDLETDLSVLSDYFDSSSESLFFQNLLLKINNSKPDYFVETEGYSLDFFGEMMQNYNESRTFTGYPEITLYEKPKS